MPRIVIDEDRCKGCGLCTLPCPYDLVHMADHFNTKGYRPSIQVDPEGKCTGCALCAMVCPDVAITVYKEDGKRQARSADGVDARAAAAHRPTREEE